MSRYELLWCDWCNPEQDTEPLGQDDARDQGWGEWWGTETRQSALGDGFAWQAPVTVDLCPVCKNEPDAIADCERRGLKEG